MSYGVIISLSAMVDYGRWNTLHANGFFSSCLLFFLSFSFLPPKPIALGNISENQGGEAPCTIALERKGCVCGGIGTEGERGRGREGENKNCLRGTIPHVSSSTRVRV